MRLRHISVVCAILAITFALAFVKKAQGPEGLMLDAQGRPQLTDHLALWSAGKLAAEGRATAAYDWPAHAAKMAEALGREPSNPLPFSYPPSFMLVLAPLSHLPFTVSFVLFGLLTLVPFALVCGRSIGRPEAAFWMLATIPPFWNFAVGQTGALAAALMGAGLVLLPVRPLLAGAMFGLLTFKPHLGLLVPVALAAAGQWRAVASAGATAVGLALVSLAVHGLEPWLAFASSLSSFGAFALADSNATAFKMQSLFGVLRTIGMPAQVALAAQVTLALGLAALTWHLWRRPGAHDLKAAILLALAVLMSPYAFHYDLTFLSVSMAFLLRHAIAGKPWDSAELAQRDMVVLLLVNALIMLFPPLQFPTGFLASVALVGVLLHRLRQEDPRALAKLARRVERIWHRPGRGVDVGPVSR